MCKRTFWWRSIFIFLKCLVLIDISFNRHTNKNRLFGQLLRELRLQWISAKMKIRHPWQLKKKILGAVLELPAKLHSQFSPFVPFLRLFIWAEFPWDLGPQFFGHNISFLGSAVWEGGRLKKWDVSTWYYGNLPPAWNRANLSGKNCSLYHAATIQHFRQNSDRKSMQP